MPVRGHITCLEISPNRPERTNGKKKQPWKTLQNSGNARFFRMARKKTRPEILRLLETLRKPWENQRLRPSGRQAPGSGAMRPPAARPEITMAYLGNHWKMNVFSCPGSCNTVRSAESLCAAWEILWLLENLGNRWKTCFLHVWQNHFQRVRMGCPVRCAEKLEWSLQGRHRKSVNPNATMSGNDVRNSGRSARPRPPPTHLSFPIAIPK